MRMVLISTMSAPQAKSCPVMSFMSFSVTPSAGSSNRAEPPPDTRNSTVSSAVSPLTCSSSALVPLSVFSSSTGCPASYISSPAISPIECSYFVTTAPEIPEPRISPAALAILHAALPIDATITRPLPLRDVNAGLFNASFTAFSGSTASIERSIISFMSCLRLCMIIPPCVNKFLWME